MRKAAGSMAKVDLKSRISELKAQFSPIITLDAPMAAYTAFRAGGPADALAAPRNMAELAELVAWCRTREVPFMVLGAGTNLLVKDAGIRGVVITLAQGFREISRRPSEPGTVRVQAMAGARLAALCRFCLARGLAGMNFAIGIPGSVGGAIVMNAGTVRGDIDSVIDDITVLFPDGRVQRLRRPGFKLSYRDLRIGDGDHPGAVVVSGAFVLAAADRKVLREEARRIILARRARQPWKAATAGSFFKNPPSGEPAGRLIDLCGMKGFSIGDAQVSRIHANFIVNRGRAAAADILAVMEAVQKAVYERFNVQLETEVNIVGA